MKNPHQDNYNSLDYQAFLGAVSMISEEGSAIMTEAAGIQQAELDLLSKTSSFCGKDRPSVTTTLEKLCTGVCDVIGIPSFPVPAEYLAAVIAFFVTPSNIKIACSWSGGRNPSSEALVNGLPMPKNIQAERLFTFCMYAFNRCDLSKFRHQFNSSVKESLKNIPKGAN